MTDIRRAAFESEYIKTHPGAWLVRYISGPKLGNYLFIDDQLAYERFIENWDARKATGHE